MQHPVRVLVLFAAVVALSAATIPAAATHDPGVKHRNMNLLFNSPTGATNSDLAFWGDRAYVGNYNGFRIFDISNPATPVMLQDFPCFGPQNDVSVWENEILVLSIDRTLAGPRCGQPAVAHDDPTGWEGLRIFDVSNPAAPVMIKAVYQDCGSHTNTMVPDLDRNRLLIYNQSYPLRPGPTCGQTNGPSAGRDPNHGVIQVVSIPLADPSKAREIAEPPVTYPGDPDNKFVPAEHGLPGPPTLEPSMRACHDAAVFLDPRLPGTQPGDLGLVGAACAEQAQIWRIQSNGLPASGNPVWVFDDNQDANGITGDPNDPDVAVDFWHSATFSWDGKIVNFSDESFGSTCPSTTPAFSEAGGGPADTGRTWFFDLATGTKLSHYQIPRNERDAYCSTHQGNVVPIGDRYLLVQAWYMGGADIVDFTNPANPKEIAFWDFRPNGATGSDNWSHYWYEGPNGPGDLTTYGQDGVHNPPTGRGFEVFSVDVGETADVNLGHLNPQTQEDILFPAP